jgi:hypothetical protein
MSRFLNQGDKSIQRVTWESKIDEYLFYGRYKGLQTLPVGLRIINTDLNWKNYTKIIDIILKFIVNKPQ